MLALEKIENKKKNIKMKQLDRRVKRQTYAIAFVEGLDVAIMEGLDVTVMEGREVTIIGGLELTVLEGL